MPQLVEDELLERLLIESIESELSKRLLTQSARDELLKRLLIESAKASLLSLVLQWFADIVSCTIVVQDVRRSIRLLTEGLGLKLSSLSDETGRFKAGFLLT